MFIRTFLEPYDYKYLDIEELFDKHNSTKKDLLQIQAIEKVYNPTLLRNFERKKAEYKRMHGTFQILKLFHGTPKCNIHSILERNLEVNRHGQNVGHRFGAGVSFSAFASYASHYCDKVETGQMLLCLVLVSNIIEVPEIKEQNSMLREPPFIPGRYPLRYDTTAKNSATMDVIVKFEDHTYYPEFVVHFKRTPKIPTANIGWKASDVFDFNLDGTTYRISNLPPPHLMKPSGFQDVHASQRLSSSYQRQSTSPSSYARAVRGINSEPFGSKRKAVRTNHNQYDAGFQSSYSYHRHHQYNSSYQSGRPEGNINPDTGGDGYGRIFITIFLIVLFGIIFESFKKK